MRERALGAAAIVAALIGLAGCHEDPRDALRPLRPGLWRVSTTVDHSRADIDAKPELPVITNVCTHPDTRSAGVALSFRQGCKGSFSLDTVHSIWNFTSTCAAEGTRTEGMVWGNFDRTYVIERYIAKADATDPNKTTVVHESVNAKWVGKTCDKR